MTFRMMGPILKFYIRRSVCYHTNVNLATRRLAEVNLGERDPQNRLPVLANAAA